MNILSCDICNDFLKDPITTICGCSFCLICLKNKNTNTCPNHNNIQLSKINTWQVNKKLNELCTFIQTYKSAHINLNIKSNNRIDIVKCECKKLRNNILLNNSAKDKLRTQAVHKLELEIKELFDKTRSKSIKNVLKNSTMNKDMNQIKNKTIKIKRYQRKFINNKKINNTKNTNIKEISIKKISKSNNKDISSIKKASKPKYIPKPPNYSPNKVIKPHIFIPKSQLQNLQAFNQNNKLTNKKLKKLEKIKVNNHPFKLKVVRVNHNNYKKNENIKKNNELIYDENDGKNNSGSFNIDFDQDVHNGTSIIDIELED